MPVDEASRAQLKSIRVPFDGTLDQLLAACGTVCRVNVFFMTEEAKSQVWTAVDADASLRRAASLPCNVEVTDVSARSCGSALAVRSPWR